VGAVVAEIGRGLRSSLGRGPPVGRRPAGGRRLEQVVRRAQPGVIQCGSSVSRSFPRVYRAPASPRLPRRLWPRTSWPGRSSWSPASDRPRWRLHPAGLRLDRDQLPDLDRFFTVSPLVVVGSLEEDGTSNLAPKNLATPLGWSNYFGFVCTHAHRTYKNISRGGSFTVSFPGPSQVLLASLAAAPGRMT
jgi:hypothetical protein